jgi:transposase
MTEKNPVGGQPATRRKYTPTFKAECVRQVVAGARQTDVARAQGISPALLDRGHCQALEQAVPSSAEREGIKRLCAELKRVEIERDILKKAVIIFAQPQP